MPGFFCKVVCLERSAEPLRAAGVECGLCAGGSWKFVPSCDDKEEVEAEFAGEAEGLVLVLGGLLVVVVVIVEVMVQARWCS